MALPTFNLIPVVTGYTVVDGIESLSTQFAGGAGRYRTGIANSTCHVSVTWNLKSDQYRTWRSFFNSIVAKGALPFYINLLLDGTVPSQCKAYFIPGSIKLNSTNALQFVINAELEVVLIKSIVQLAVAPLSGAVLTSDNYAFGIGNGLQTNFPISFVPGILKQDDGQGLRQLYSTPRTNCILHSQDIAGWGSDGSSVITSQVGIAPDSTTAIVQVNETATTNSHYAYCNNWPVANRGPGRWTMSVFYHPGNTLSRFPYIHLQTQGMQIGVRFDANGNPSSQYGTGYVGSKSIPAGNGWRKYSIVADWTAGSTYIPLALVGTVATPAGAAYLGDVTKFYNVWGFHIEAGDVLANGSGYIPTVGSVVTVTDYSIS